MRKVLLAQEEDVRSGSESRPGNQLYEVTTTTSTLTTGHALRITCDDAALPTRPFTIAMG